MVIKNVLIENFRGINHLELNLEQLTGIVGENGVGKTSILDAINLALSPYYLSSRVDISDFNYESEGQFSIKIEFDQNFIAKLPDGWNSREVPCIGVALVVKKRERATPGKAFSDGFTTSHYLIPDDSARKLTRNGDKWSMPRKGDDSRPFKFTYRHLRVSNAEDTELPKSFLFDKDRENQSKIGFNSTLQRLTDDFNWRFRKNIEEIEEPLIQVWDELYDLVMDNVGDAKLRETIRPLRNKLSKIISDEFEDLELSLLSLKEPFGKSFFSIRKGLHQIKRDELGSGISMFLTFLFLNVISNLSNEQIIIMIDEPELHLHPQFQKRLFKFLSDEDNNQIIYTSHSENFIDIGQWRGIRRLDNNFEAHPKQKVLNQKLSYKGHEQTIEKHLNDLYKYYFDKSVITKEHNEILFARKCLLVEGPIEKYAFDVLSNRFNYNFEDLTIIKANGKEKLKNLQLICKAFGIPYFTVFDLDDKDNEDDENKALKSFSGDSNYYAFPKTFEHVLGTQNADRKTSESMSRIEELEELPKLLKEALDSIDEFIDTTK